MVVRYIRKSTHQYITVGSPTITNGIASDFSSSNYFKLENFPLKTGNWEIVLKASTTYNSSQVNQYIIDSSDDKFYVKVHKLDDKNLTFWDVGVNGGEEHHYAEIEDYPYIKLKKDGDYFHISFSKDGFAYVFAFDSFRNLAMGNVVDADLLIGKRYSGTNNWLGTLDLNESYIKANGESWMGKGAFIPTTQISATLSDSFLNRDALIPKRCEPVFEEDSNSIKIGDGVSPYNDLPYLADNSTEWHKPADWLDLRSFAATNSVYMLVGHSADYSAYPKFAFSADISSSGTYDVYIDGVKNTSAVTSGSTTNINWQTLALTSGWDTTHPAALKTHIIRITPTDSTNNIVHVRLQPIDGQNNIGVLWIHYALTNEISLQQLHYDANISTSLLEAVTATGDEIKLRPNVWQDELLSAFGKASNLQTIPTISTTRTATTRVSTSFVGCYALKKIHLKGVNFGTTYNAFQNCNSVREIILENCKFGDSYGGHFHRNYMLRKLPSTDYSQLKWTFSAEDLYSLEDTFVDLSGNDNITKIQIGSSNPTAKKIKGIRGLLVSNKAPFTESGSNVKLDVKGCNLDRNALVALFNSMPYNVGYEVVGSPTITSGVASGFSSSSYLETSSALSVADNTPFEFYMTYGCVSGNTGATTFSGKNDALTFGYYDSSKFPLFRIRQSNDTEYKQFVVNYQMSVDNTYSIKAVYNGENLVCYLYDSSLALLHTETFNGENLNISSSTPYRIGARGTSPYAGPIDLNNTYIKVNGVPWFTGKAAMTKTCSVVGCTGTADLTQDDKNIALNKGWELTVA